MRQDDGRLEITGTKDGADAKGNDFEMSTLNETIISVMNDHVYRSLAKSITGINRNKKIKSFRGMNS